MPLTCALCGGRDATTETDYEERVVPACDVCVAEVADPPPVVVLSELAVSKRAVEYVRRHPGLTAIEVNEALELESLQDRNAATAGLSRALRDGLLSTAGERGEWRKYYPTEATPVARPPGRRPRPHERRVPIAPIDEPVLERLDWRGQTRVRTPSGWRVAARLIAENMEADHG